MKWFYDLKIAHKLNAGFLVVLVFIVGLGGFSLIQLEQVNKSSAELARDWLPSIDSLSKISLALARSRSFDMQQVLTDDVPVQALAQSGYIPIMELLSATARTLTHSADLVPRSLHAL